MVASESGIAHAEELLALAEAMVDDDETMLAGARARVLKGLGPEALVDAVAVISNFERMVRIADGTGIPLDPPIAAMSEELRYELGLDRFAASVYTPSSGPLARGLGRAARRLLPPVARVLLAARDRLERSSSQEIGSGGRRDGEGGG